MGDVLDPSQVEDFTGSVLAVSQTFGTDFNEVIKTTNSMMRNFGIDGQEALDIITWGFQNGANASDDMLDTMWEYSTQFSDLGYTADETMKLIEQGMKKGTFNTDKLADSVKEANIRLKEMPKATSEAVKNLGLDVSKVQKNIGEGGETAKNQMTELAKSIIEIEDPIKQNEYAIAIFGTMFEDLGMDGVEALANIDTSLMNTEGKTNDVKAGLEESFGMTMQGTIDSFNEILAEIGKTFAPVIEVVGQLAQKFADFLSQNPAISEFIGLIAVFVAVFVGLASVAGLATIAMSAFTFVVGILTSPVGIIILAISALVTALLWLINNWDWAWQQITAFVQWIGDAIVNGFNWACTFVIDLITGFISGVIGFFNMLLDGIIGIITWIVDGIISGFNSACTFVINLISGFINGVISFFSALLNGIISAITSISDSIVNGFNSACDWALDAINGFIGWVGDLFGNIPGMISRALSGLYNIITSPFKKAWDFISGIGSKIGNIASNIMGWLPFSITPDLTDQLPNLPQMLSTVSVNGEMFTPQTARSKSIQEVFNFTKSGGKNTSSNENNLLNKLIDILDKPDKPTSTGGIQILVQVGDKELKEDMYKYTVKRITRESKSKSKMKG